MFFSHEPRHSKPSVPYVLYHFSSMGHTLHLPLSKLSSLEPMDVSNGPGCSPCEERISVEVMEFIELCTFSEVRSGDFPVSDMCLLSFKACYADLSCENGCSQLCWRCFAICHEMRFVTLLQVKHQIDLNSLLRGASCFQNHIFLFSLHWIVIFTKR